MEDFIKYMLQPYNRKVCNVTLYIGYVGEIRFDLCSIEYDYEFFNHIFIQTIEDETIGFNACAVQGIESLKTGGLCISFINDVKLHVNEYTLEDLESRLKSNLAKIDEYKSMLTDKLKTVQSGSFNIGNKVKYRLNSNGGYIIF